MNIHPIISISGRTVGHFLKKHYRTMLFFVFIIAIVLWVFIFWQYVYQMSLYDPHAEVRPLPIKQKELTIVIDDLNKRAEIQNSITSKTFPEPFIEPPKELK